MRRSQKIINLFNVKFFTQIGVILHNPFHKRPFPAHPFNIIWATSIFPYTLIAIFSYVCIGLFIKKICMLFLFLHFYVDYLVKAVLIGNFCGSIQFFCFSSALLLLHPFVNGKNGSNDYENTDQENKKN